MTNETLEEQLARAKADQHRSNTNYEKALLRADLEESNWRKAGQEINRIQLLIEEKTNDR